MSQHPIQLNTPFGVEQFNILQSQFSMHSKNGLREEFRNRCVVDLARQEKYLEYFLDSEELGAEYRMNEDDKEGFRIFNEHSDVYSCLKYFSDKKY